MFWFDFHWSLIQGVLGYTHEARVTCNDGTAKTCGSFTIVLKSLYYLIHITTYIMETREVVSKQCKYTSLQKVHHVHNKSIYTAWHLHFLEYVVPISKVEWFVCSGTESSLY